MNSIINLLDSYRGRDCVIRTFSYATLYLSYRFKGSYSRKFKTISKELSYCRIILRLFDDFPMLQFSLKYGLGSNVDETLFLRILGVLKNLLDQIYYPVEHIAWAADKNLIELNSSLFYFFGTVLWGLSSYISIIRSLIKIAILQKKTKGVKNVVLHEQIVSQQMELLIGAFKDVADLVIAINYFPQGSLLWAGKFKGKEIGLIGSISSILRLVLLLRNTDVKPST